MFPHHSDKISQRSQVSRVALCISKVKVLVPGGYLVVPGSYLVVPGGWFLAVICWFLAVICGSLSVSVGSWRLYVGSWRSSAVPGGYLWQGHLLSCSGQLKKVLNFTTGSVLYVWLPLFVGTIWCEILSLIFKFRSFSILVFAETWQILFSLYHLPNVLSVAMIKIKIEIYFC